MSAPVTIRYFAWVRARLGRDSDQLPLPENGETVRQIIARLAGLSADHAAVFADPARLKAAINQQFAELDATVRPGDELALFPPVTGG